MVEMTGDALKRYPKDVPSLENYHFEPKVMEVRMEDDFYVHFGVIFR